MTYNIFISHSWRYGDQYNSLLGLLNSNPYFSYKNYSVPKDDPIHYAKNESQLKEAIRRQMQPASCVLILAGVYANYSKWINIEIGLAQEMGKKIIAVEYWGADHTSSVVKNAADVVVRWNSGSIISAIRGY
jgi:hypothetical protein